MNNLKEVADLAGMDFNKVLEMQYNESAKMKKLFNVSELPFDFQYAQDHLFGLAEAKELGDSKIAKQTILDSGIGKMKRRSKENIDKISATLILQSYLKKNNYD